MQLLKCSSFSLIAVDNIFEFMNHHECEYGAGVAVLMPQRYILYLFLYIICFPPKTSPYFQHPFL